MGYCCWYSTEGILWICLLLSLLCITDATTSLNIREVKLDGYVVYPDSPAYYAARLDWNYGVPPSFPDFIVFCASVDDVIAVINFASVTSTNFTVRSGRHSYESFSLPQSEPAHCKRTTGHRAQSTNNGFVIDISLMNGKRIDEKRGIAVFGAGNKLLEVFLTLGEKGYIFPTGTCPTVGLSGYVLGGGIGFFSRMYGMGIDQILEFEIVTASGARIRASPDNEHSDLFWACKGGGQGNFGVVTEIVIRLNRAPTLMSSYTATWPNLDQFNNVFEFLQQWLSAQGPDKLGANVAMFSNSFTSTGYFLGSAAELKQRLQPFIQRFGPTMNRFVIGESPFVQGLLNLTGCGSSVSECWKQVSRTPIDESVRWKAKSTFIFEPLTSTQLSTLSSYLPAHWPTSNFSGDPMIIIDALGGAIREPANDSPMPYRNATFHLQYMQYFDHYSDRQKANDWIAEWFEKTRPRQRHSTKEDNNAFVNYPDVEISDYMRAYFGESNSKRLTEIKARYDPSNMFCYKQSIPLP